MSLRSCPSIATDEAMLSSVHAGTTTLIGITTTSIAMPSAPPNPVLPRRP